MQLTVKGKSIHLDRNEVTLAKKLALEQMRICRETIGTEENPSFYITYLLMLHLMSEEAIEALDENVLAMAFRIKSEQ